MGGGEKADKLEHEAPALVGDPSAIVPIRRGDQRLFWIRSFYSFFMTPDNLFFRASPGWLWKFNTPRTDSYQFGRVVRVAGGQFAHDVADSDHEQAVIVVIPRLCSRSRTETRADDLDLTTLLVVMAIPLRLAHPQEFPWSLESVFVNFLFVSCCALGWSVKNDQVFIKWSEHCVFIIIVVLSFSLHQSVLWIFCLRITIYSSLCNCGLLGC